MLFKVFDCVFARQAEGSGPCRPGPSCNTQWPVMCFLRLLAGLVFLYAPVNSVAGPARTCGALVSGSAIPVLPSRTGHDASSSRAYTVVARYPHDRNAFTQGLAFYQGALYESTGMHGRSSVRRIDPETGHILDSRRLDRALFGEGLTVANRQLVQLTWKSGSAFTYAPGDLRRTGRFSFEGEGWGVAGLDGKLVVSDGSSRLRFFRAGDFRQAGSLRVTYRGWPVEGLNELEQVDGLLYANVYPGDCIAMINPQSGQVTGWIDLDGLMPLSERRNGAAVANGIAYHPESGDLFVTGKLWPYLFRIKLRAPKDLENRRTAGPDSTG